MKYSLIFKPLIGIISNLIKNRIENKKNNEKENKMKMTNIIFINKLILK